MAPLRCFKAGLDVVLVAVFPLKRCVAQAPPSWGGFEGARGGSGLMGVSEFTRMARPKFKARMGETARASALIGFTPQFVR